MAKRILAFLIMAMACFGLARAADIPAETLMPTVLDPPELLILASAPAPDLTDLRLPETVFVSQSNPALLNPFGGFRPAADPGDGVQSRPVVRRGQQLADDPAGPGPMRRSDERLS